VYGEKLPSGSNIVRSASGKNVDLEKYNPGTTGNLADEHEKTQITSAEQKVRVIAVLPGVKRENTSCTQETSPCQNRRVLPPGEFTGVITAISHLH